MPLLLLSLTTSSGSDRKISVPAATLLTTSNPVPAFGIEEAAIRRGTLESVTRLRMWSHSLGCSCICFLFEFGIVAVV